jgi:polyphenol oxidase
MTENIFHPIFTDINTNPALQTLDLLRQIRPDIRYGFSSTKFGNMSFRYSPLEGALDNRSRFLNAVGINIENLVAMSPVHGVNIEVVSEANSGSGAFDFESAIPKTDGLITEDKNIALAVNPADCSPIIFTVKDRINPVRALAHAGKVGADLGIGKKMVEELRGGFGIHPDQLLVGIGPSILCYPENPLVTTNPDLWLAFAYNQGFQEPELSVEEFTTKKGELAYKIKNTRDDRKLYFDLAEVNVAQLVNVGIPRENIDVSKVCTYCNALKGITYSDIAMGQGLQETARFMAVVQ